MVKHSSVDSIFMLQETHSTPNDEEDWRNYIYNGRILILDVEIQNKPYLMINLYADNDQAGQLS